MAGLLDIFGTSGTGALSLLGGGDIEQARNDAQAQALYALAGRLFQGGGTGQSIAEGLQMGQQAYKQAMQGELSDRLTQFQLQEFKRKREEELASKLRAEQARKALMGAYVPPQTGTPELPPTTYGYEDVAVPGTYGVEGRAATPARFDQAKIAPALMSGAYGPEGLSLLTQILQMEKLGRPEFHALPEGSTGIAYDPLSQGFKKVAEGAPKEKPTPAEIQGYQLAQSQGYEGSFFDYQIALNKSRANSNQNIVYPPGALAPDKPTVTNLQEQLLQSSARLSSYNKIESGFKPEYFQPSFRAGQNWNAIKEKAGANLNEQERNDLAKFSQFKQNAAQELNAAIKAQTGATVTESEAPRIIAGLPNPGTGLFDGDSPTEFKAKLDNTIKQLRFAEARNVYALRNGLSLKNIPLDSVPKLMNDRAAELAKQYQVNLKSATPKQIDAIKRQLAIEFGITAD